MFVHLMSKHLISLQFGLTFAIQSLSSQAQKNRRSSFFHADDTKSAEHALARSATTHAMKQFVARSAATHAINLLQPPGLWPIHPELSGKLLLNEGLLFF